MCSNRAVLSSPKRASGSSQTCSDSPQHAPLRARAENCRSNGIKRLLVAIAPATTIAGLPPTTAAVISVTADPPHVLCEVGTVGGVAYGALRRQRQRIGAVSEKS